MRFKAKLATTISYPSKGQNNFRIHTSKHEFIFSKTRIFHSPKLIVENAQDYFIVQDIVKNLQEYELIKLEQYDNLMEWSKDSKFQAKLKNGTTLNLITDFRNGILLRIIHGRYWFYREREWFTKTVIAALIGFLFGIMGVYVGYKLGIQNSTKSTTTLPPTTSQPNKR
jgi:hypothetical protein